MMTNFSKIMRFIWSFMLYFFVVVFAFGIILFFIVQTSSFQTYLGRKATDWLSKELKTELKIDRISIDFFNSINLNGLLIKDLRNDTLVYFKDVTCILNELDLKKNKLHFLNI